MGREIEYKWQAHSIGDYKAFLQLAETLGAKLSKGKRVPIQDQYLDTPEKLFQNSQLECRIRFSAGHAELTLKGLSKPDQALFNRYEQTLPLPGLNTKKAALSYCQKHIFRNIAPLFEIVNNRQIHTLILPCGTRAEASLDQVVMERGKKKFPMREIELEFKSGSIKKFRAFVRKLTPLSLTPSRSSKFEVAMKQLLGDFRSRVTLQEMVGRIVKKNYEKLKKIAARRSLNAEAIHDMRVASRRLRAAMQTFKKVLPAKAKKIQRELQKLGLILGKKRDLDVFSAAVKARSKLARDREKSEKQIVSRLQSKGHARLIGSLEQLKTVVSQNSTLKIAAKEIRKALRRVLEIAPSIDSKADDKTLHTLRISAKKLRYTCEFFAPLFSFDAFIEKTKQIQDVLGEHQDAIAGVFLLNRYKSSFSAEEFVRIKKSNELKKKRARTAFSKIWKEYCPEIGFRNSLPLAAIGLILEEKI